MLNKYVIDNTLWYLINSYNYTLDTGGFEFNPKKIERVSAGNILEYTLMYFLEMANIPFETDKMNPFKIDNGVDILVNGNIPLHCKASSIYSLLGQVRNGKGLISEMKQEGGYIVIGYIHYTIVNNIKILIEQFLNNGGKFPSNKKALSIEEILYFIGDINYDVIINNNKWQDNIKIKGLVPVEEYFNNSYFVAEGETIPGTKFTQFFREGSYFLNKDYNNFYSLNDLLH